MIKNVILGLTFVCSLASVIISLYQKSYSDKFVYVNTTKLYSDFEYAKQLHKDFEKMVTARKTILDSLYEATDKITKELKYKKTQSELDMNMVTEMQNDYFAKKEQFARDNESVMNIYNEKIWTQINEYVQQYGKEKGMNIVFGANSQGSIMYGNSPFDITEEVLDYINNKFNDKI